MTDDDRLGEMLKFLIAVLLIVAPIILMIVGASFPKDVTTHVITDKWTDTVFGTTVYKFELDEGEVRLASPLDYNNADIGDVYIKEVPSSDGGKLILSGLFLLFFGLAIVAKMYNW